MTKEEFLLKQQHINATTAGHKKVYTKRSNMTVSEKLDLPLALFSIPIVGFLALLTGSFRARKQKFNPKQPIARSLLLHVGYAILRRFVSRFSPLQIQCVFLSIFIYPFHMYSAISGEQS
jgi:hypothetical protein